MDINKLDDMIGGWFIGNFTPSLYFGLLTDLAMIAAVAGALLLLPQLILVFRPLGPEGGR